LNFGERPTHPTDSIVCRMPQQSCTW